MFTPSNAYAATTAPTGLRAATQTATSAGHPDWINGTYIDSIMTTPMRVSEWQTVTNVDSTGNTIGQIPPDHNMIRATVWLPH